MLQNERNEIIRQMAALKVPWEITQRPQGYQQLVMAAKVELRNKFDELMERGEAILELFRDFDSVDWDKLHFAYQTMIDYGDDDDLRRLGELIDNWPSVKSAPGEGYW